LSITPPFAIDYKNHYTLSSKNVNNFLSFSVTFFQKFQKSTKKEQERTHFVKRVLFPPSYIFFEDFKQ